MNLAIDIGNTLIKTGVFDKMKRIDHQVVDRAVFFDFLKKTKNKFPGIDAAIVSHVGKIEPVWMSYLQDQFKAIEFSANTPVAFTNTYKTPETLGLDRLALMAAAHEKYPKKNTLVIDAGTSITYDFLDEKGNYHGGAISPGIQMRFKALNTFTDRLPLIPSVDEPNFLGKSTKEGIQAGVFWGVVHEINGFIKAYLKKYSDLTIILTGGDAQTLSKSIKNTIFAPSYFLLEGLNSILEFNKAK